MLVGIPYGCKHTGIGVNIIMYFDEIANHIMYYNLY